MAGEMTFREIVGFANKISNIEYIKRSAYSANLTSLTYAQPPS